MLDPDPRIVLRPREIYREFLQSYMKPITMTTYSMLIVRYKYLM